MQSTDSGETAVLDQVIDYRTATPTDIEQCFELQNSSFHHGESASKNDLRYAQHHAALFFRCAVEHHDEEYERVVAFLCSTRCEPDDEENTTKSHQAEVTTLLIHSFVMHTDYQHQELGSQMMADYISSIEDFNETTENPVSRLVLFAEETQLAFYLRCGFSVIRPSSHGALFFLEKKMEDASHRQVTTEHKDAVKCYIVDSFASAPGTGNPAAVVLLPSTREADIGHTMEKWMQTVAAEFNLSETAFCWPSSRRASGLEEHWDIRYYTPTVEILLCGHATLASAAVLYQTLYRHAENRIVVFHAREDDLRMERENSEYEDTSLRTRIAMSFPCKPPRELETADDKLTVRMMLESAFSCKLDPLYVGISDIGDVLVELRMDDFLAIGHEKIQFKALMEWDGYFRGVIVCCRVDEEVSASMPEIGEKIDFLSRFFGPKAGINEDPVTGSAHCVLAPYYSNILGKNKVIGQQMSKRSGTVECQLESENVRITGTAVTTMTGWLWMKKEETNLPRRIIRARSESGVDD